MARAACCRPTPCCAAPDVEIAIVDGTHASLLQQLCSAEVDPGALRAEPGSDEARHETLFTDDPVVVARAGHPCLGQRGASRASLLQCHWNLVLLLDERQATGRNKQNESLDRAAALVSAGLRCDPLEFISGRSARGVPPQKPRDST